MGTAFDSPTRTVWKRVIDNHKKKERILDRQNYRKLLEGLGEAFGSDRTQIRP